MHHIIIFQLTFGGMWRFAWKPQQLYIWPSDRRHSNTTCDGRNCTRVPSSYLETDRSDACIVILLMITSGYCPGYLVITTVFCPQSVSPQILRPSESTETKMNDPVISFALRRRRFATVRPDPKSTSVCTCSDLFTLAHAQRARNKWVLVYFFLLRLVESNSNPLIVRIETKRWVEIKSPFLLVCLSNGKRTLKHIIYLPYSRLEHT